MLKYQPDLETFLNDCRNADVVPVFCKVLADHHTAVSLLRRFYKEPNQNGIFLLESAEGGEKWGRYSFLGIETHTFIDVLEDTVVITETNTGNAETIPHHNKPLDVLRTIMQRYKPAESENLPRFFGGLVGYFTYEMTAFFENIPHKLKDEPFARFVIPKVVLILDNAKQSLTVCVLAFPKKDAPKDELKTLYREAIQHIEKVCGQLEEPLDAKQPSAEDELNLTAIIPEYEYRKRVGIIKEHIKNGDIIQCVFSQPFVTDSAPDSVSLYRALRFANPSPYLFFMHLGDTVLVGSSPETMVRLEGRTATLRPIAGTRKRGNTEQRDRELADEMLRDPKEKAEHLMLVDLGRNDLGRIAKTGTVQVTDLMFIERYSHVMHLVSNVTAQLEDGLDGFHLFESAFPAGTLSGAPKVRAMQIIAEQEDTARGPYGGAAGYISFNGNIDFAITIRTAKIRNGKLTAQAGGGIVYDSDPELERKETVNKAMGISRALSLLTR
ncbi:MAG: anthranilate synthase component I family protein [Planctomycetaceae bacterium]|nr:anthranilate synthase component I family protein [Planctomycetaceae bacterium]